MSIFSFMFNRDAAAVVKAAVAPPAAEPVAPAAVAGWPVLYSAHVGGGKFVVAFGHADHTSVAFWWRALGGCCEQRSYHSGYAHVQSARVRFRGLVSVELEQAAAATLEAEVV